MSKTHSSNLIRYCALFLFLFIAAGNIMAQKVSVNGIITDATNGLPLFGVSIGITGTTTGTISDADGKFSIQVPSKEAVLVFTSVGYKPQQIVVGENTQLNIALVLEMTQLEQIVVVGYGTQRKKDLTGSISLVSTKDIKSLAVPSVSDALQGRAAGVQVI
jgi:TonB-dependent starch-binding outer membrane protein SusC